MANYELMIIVDPFLEDAEHQAMLDKASELIKRYSGNITQVDPWGKRRLAYPINKKLEGYYALLTFDGTIEGASIAEIERVLRLEEKVMRVMITRVPVLKVRKSKKKAEGENARSTADTMSAGAAGQQPQGR